MFEYGNVHYSNRVRNSVTSSELQYAMKLFKNKFWGNVDKETWNKNEIAVDEKKGMITASYKFDDFEFFIIRLEDCSLTIVLDKQDRDENYIENNFGKFKKKRAYTYSFSLPTSS